MTDEQKYEGGCTCGAVRYRMESEPLIVHCCHCTWCQRETGASFAQNALIEADRVTLLQGEPELIATPSNSGLGQNFFRCPECRIAVWSHYSGAGDLLTFIRVGTLDEAYRLPPDVHIFTSTKQPWVIIPDGLPDYAEFYPRGECWSAESVARRSRMLELSN